MFNSSARIIAGGFALAAVATLSACGGDSDRPTAAELSKVMQDDASFAALGEDVADCMAKAYVDSDVSDEALRAMVEMDEDYKGSKKDTEEAMSVALEAAGDCVGEVPTPTDAPSIDSETPGDTPTTNSESLSEDIEGLSDDLDELSEESLDDLQKQMEELEKLATPAAE